MGLLPFTRMYLSSQAGWNWSRHQDHKSAGCRSVQHSHHHWDGGRQPQHGLMGSSVSKKAYEQTVLKSWKDLTGICPTASPPGHLGNFSSTMEHLETSGEGPTCIPDNVGTQHAFSKFSEHFSSSASGETEAQPRVFSSSG